MSVGCICKLFLAVVIFVNLLPGNTQLTGGKSTLYDRAIYTVLTRNNRRRQPVCVYICKNRCTAGVYYENVAGKAIS